METTPESNVLLVGAGGLGCEIVRSLVVQGAERITIVDPDTIEVHNLSRQLLYRHDDVGKYKAQVAAQRIREHHRQVKVDSIATGIQEVPLETIAKFDVVVSAVDNVEARRWINLATMVIWEQRMNGGTSEAGEAVVRPLLVDGGSQELYGHVRVVSGRDQPCLECSMPLFSNKADEPSCSVPRKPRTPEDCVRYVISEKFSEYFGEEGRGIPDHEIVERIREDAVGYAKLSGIGAVTREVVRRVVNNQPINVVTTNAIVAAIVARVVLTRDAAKNFYFYSGDGSTVFDAFNMEKQQDCTLCNCQVVAVEGHSQWTLRELVRLIESKVGCGKVNISSDKGTVYMGASRAMEALYRHRLGKTLSELGDVMSDRLYVTTQSGGTWYYVQVKALAAVTGQ